MLRALRSRIRKFLRRILWRDFNYYPIAYRKANLEENYWSIVGPASAEEFSELGRVKRELLVAQGLTPRSRVLDVGCGTGLLTAALDEYLSPDGLYVGTDIAPEAVSFCQRKFQKPNFRFVRSEMTRVPIASGTFDFIFFGSVFTHIYPREITALLVDVGRLLEDRGRIIADAFSASGIGTWRGERGMVVIDEDLLLKSFRDAGYVHDVIQDKLWEPGVQRRIFQLRLQH